MNINVESQEAILSRDIVIVPKIAKKASKINYMSVKRVFDLVISTIGLIILSPIFLILAIIVKLDSKDLYFLHIQDMEKMEKNSKCTNLEQCMKMHKI